MARLALWLREGKTLLINTIGPEDNVHEEAELGRSDVFTDDILSGPVSNSLHVFEERRYRRRNRGVS